MSLCLRSHQQLRLYGDEATALSLPTGGAVDWFDLVALRKRNNKQQRRECSGSVVGCLTEGPRVRASPASLRCGPWAKHIYPSLVLVQPRKTCPCLTERLLMGHTESNQTNKINSRRTRKLTSSLEVIWFYTPHIRWFLWHENIHQLGKTCLELGTSLLTENKRQF